MTPELLRAMLAAPGQVPVGSAAVAANIARLEALEALGQVLAAPVESGIDMVASTVEMVAEPFTAGQQALGVPRVSRFLGPCGAPGQALLKTFSLAVETGVNAVAFEVETALDPFPPLLSKRSEAFAVAEFVRRGALVGQGWGGAGRSEDQQDNGRMDTHGYSPLGMWRECDIACLDGRARRGGVYVS